MKSLVLLKILLITNLCLIFSQNYQEVVYLNNDSIVKGIIIEQILNEQIKIKTANGNIAKYEMDKIKKIEKEVIKSHIFLSPIDADEIIMPFGKCYITQNGRILTFRFLKLVTVNNQNAFKYAKIAKRKFNWSLVMFCLTSYCLIYGIDSYSNNSPNYPNKLPWDAIIVGTSSAILTMTLWSKSIKNVNMAIDIYNSGLNLNTLNNSNIDFNLASNTNGIGLKINF